jgi:hypothetical protein
MSKQPRFADMSDEQWNRHVDKLEADSVAIYDKVERAKERVKSIFRKKT